MREQNLESKLVEHVDESWWNETIRLYVAQSDATNVIETCLTDNKLSAQTLTLAVECLEEGREVKRRGKAEALQHFGRVAPHALLGRTQRAIAESKRRPPR